MIDFAKANTKEFREFLKNEIDADIFSQMANKTKNKHIKNRLVECAKSLIDNNKSILEIENN
jgi:regulator of sirC expression with transglutaminase-like and TPR domain